MKCKLVIPEIIKSLSLCEGIEGVCYCERFILLNQDLIELDNTTVVVEEFCEINNRKIYYTTHPQSGHVIPDYWLEEIDSNDCKLKWDDTECINTLKDKIDSLEGKIFELSTRIEHLDDKIEAQLRTR